MLGMGEIIPFYVISMKTISLFWCCISFDIPFIAENDKYFVIFEGNIR